MAKELIINQTLNEYRVALIENGELLDFLIDHVGDEENERSKPVVGNIYKGVVVKVLPGIQSAFVDIGYEKAAFLHVDDAYIPSLEEQREMLRSRKKEEERVGALAASGLGMGEMIPDEMSTFAESVLQMRKNIPVSDVLQEGMEILVQVAKEPIASKGPRVTRHITLAGRYIVFMPFIEHSGVSRRIANEEERNRLKEVLDTIRPEGKGIIARTVAEGQPPKLLKFDFSMLTRIWKDVQKRAEKIKGPAIVYQDLTFIQRVLRDITDEDVDSIVCDSKEVLGQVDKFISKYLISMRGRTKLFCDETPIFEHFGIEIEVERAMSNKIYLKSGGHIYIDQTEALVSIDVNTGKFVGKKSLEETILKTNLEAVKEIAYQMRLRNCGGIIIIDFIDMEREEHRNTVFQALLEALKKDRAKTNVLPISGLGLVEMTRKRTRETLTRILCHTCPYCEGTGRVKSAATVSYEIVRELLKVVKRTKSEKIFVYAHPEVSEELCSEEMDVIDMMERTYGKTIVVRAENNYHTEQYEIYPQEF